MAEEVTTSEEAEEEKEDVIRPVGFFCRFGVGVRYWWGDGVVASIERVIG